MGIKPVRFSDYIFSLVHTTVLTVFLLTFVQSTAFSTSRIKQKQAARLYSGQLIKNGSSFSLQLANSTQIYNLSFSDSTSEKIINRLTSGDYISIQADTTAMSENILKIMNINFVGLNSLLGLWLGDDNACYYFKGFTSFIVFNVNSNGQCTIPDETTDPTKLHKASYFINPDEYDWFLVISDHKVQFAAELFIISSHTVQINLFDHQDGSILSKVILRR